MRFVVEINFKNPDLWAVDEKIMKGMIERFLAFGVYTDGFDKLMYVKEVRVLNRKPKVTS